jgi:hypothetical protein
MRPDFFRACLTPNCGAQCWLLAVYACRSPVYGSYRAVAGHLLAHLVRPSTGRGKVCRASCYRERRIGPVSADKHQPECGIGNPGGRFTDNQNSCRRIRSWIAALTTAVVDAAQIEGQR